MIILGYFFLIFLFLHKNICCGYSLEAPCRGASNDYPQYMFLLRNGENYPIIITKYTSIIIPLLYHAAGDIALLQNYIALEDQNDSHG